MVEAEVKAISIFFFLMFLDNNLAMETSNQAVNLFQKKLSKDSSLDRAALLVAVTKEIWNKNKKRLQNEVYNQSEEFAWILPSKLNIDPWRELLKSAQEEELLSLIWSKILELADESDYVGAEISVGTHRYRLGKALKKLGSLAKRKTNKSFEIVGSRERE